MAIQFERQLHRQTEDGKPVLQKVGAFVSEPLLEHYENLDRAQEKRDRIIGLTLLILCSAATFAATVTFVLMFA